MPQVNLLPPELRPQPLLRDKSLLRWLAVAGAAALIFLGALSWFAYLHGLERELVRLKNERRSLQQELQQVKQLEKTIAAKQQELEQLQQVVDSRMRWGELLEQVSDSMPRQVWLESLVLDGGSMLVIRGKTPSLAAVGVLINRLKELAFFDVVVLNRFEYLPEQPEIAEFQVTAQLLVEGSD
ncbi:MAG: PilN domain-containing protein [Thermoanaerobacteraceae bacterium]|nr:PilN domain-containing protein [Thermoanaerobacteraceae bacterium]